MAGRMMAALSRADTRAGRHAARGLVAGLVALLAACGGDSAQESSEPSISGSVERPRLIALWEADTPAFGVFVPSERERGATDADGNRLPPLYTAEGGSRLAQNERLDYLFLNLEGSYDAGAVTAMVEGLDTAPVDEPPTLLVRVPTIADAGADATRSRVAEIVAAGADGVVIPHIRSPEEARLAVSFFEEAGADVWSPANPDGTFVAMLMVEDEEAVESAADILAVPGYSMLSCGIGSLTGDMDGDREAAEAACEEVMRLGAEAGMPSMMTAGAADIVHRIDQGYLGLLLMGSTEQVNEIIEAGRAASGGG
ncbi:MAG: aldolase/citrate lyase family protein [Gemmatimonadota bacterium]